MVPPLSKNETEPVAAAGATVPLRVASVPVVVLPVMPSVVVVGVFLTATVWERVPEELLTAVDEVNAAVMVWDAPTGSAVVEQVALLLATATAEHRVVAPSVKVTEPAGVLASEALIAAVKVTLSPWTEGFSEEVRVVVLVAAAAGGGRVDTASTCCH